MEELKKWRAWFARQIATREIFQAFDAACESHLPIFLSGQLVPIHARDTGNTGGVFLDVGYDHDKQAIRMVGAYFRKYKGEFSPSPRPLILVDDCFPDDDVQRKRVPLEDSLGSYPSIEGFISYEVEDGCLRLIDLQFSFVHTRIALARDLVVRTFDMKDFMATPFNVLCAECHGHGDFKKMSIPAEDYADKTLTGYALFSCNKINGLYGCPACGGHGAIYEDWYLAQEPSLTEKRETFQRGSGIVRQPANTSVVVLA